MSNNDSDIILNAGITSGAKPRLLAIAWEWDPDTMPTGIRSVALLKRLATKWSIDVVTRRECNDIDGVNVSRVNVSESMREHLRWAAWKAEAFRTAKLICEARLPDIVLVFIMPYASAEIGKLLSSTFNRPLVYLLGDSPTCPDMHPVFPSRRHYDQAVELENSLIKASSVSIYVSKVTLERVRRRLPRDLRDKVTLLRGGSDVKSISSSHAPQGTLCLVYIGAMSGWTEYQRRGLPAIKHSLRKMLERLRRLRQYRQQSPDLLGSSPYYVGKALQRVVANNPTIDIRLHIYGERRPRQMIDRAMDAWEVRDVVTVGPVLPHDQALQKAAEADVLFMCLPGHGDSAASGGRISAKTYEYLSIDRPILAAIPNGENRDFLAGRPGVNIVDPDDVTGLVNVIEALLQKKLSAGKLFIDRSESRAEMSFDKRAEDLHKLLSDVIIQSKVPTILNLSNETVRRQGKRFSHSIPLGRNKV